MFWTSACPGGWCCRDHPFCPKWFQCIDSLVPFLCISQSLYRLLLVYCILLTLFVPYKGASLKWANHSMFWIYLTTLQGQWILETSWIILKTVQSLRVIILRIKCIHGYNIKLFQVLLLQINLWFHFALLICILLLAWSPTSDGAFLFMASVVMQ